MTQSTGIQQEHNSGSQRENTKPSKMTVPSTKRRTWCAKLHYVSGRQDLVQGARGTGHVLYKRHSPQNP